MNRFLHPVRTRTRRAGYLSAWRMAQLCALGTAVLCLTGEVPEAQASESREFSSQEEALLHAGKLVVRAEQRNWRGGHWLGGMSWQLIDAAPAEVWRALDDVSTYTRILPATVEARVLDTRGNAETLFLRHRLGFVSASYAVHVEREPTRLRFRLDHDYPSAIREAWGELRVTPYARGQSVVSLAIMADLGEGLFVGFLRSNIHAWMLRVPELLKNYLAAQRR